MAFEKVAAPKIQHSSAAPVKVSVKLRHGQPIVWLSITEQGQKDLFGRSIVGARLKIRRGTEAQEGLLELTLTTSGEHEARSGIKGSARIAVGAWSSVPRIRRTARPCEIVRTDHEAMMAVLKLPEFVGEQI